MCDTLVLRQDGVSWLAKNSDREPAEPQLWRYYPPVSDDTARMVRTTYLDIPQLAARHAVLLSQPSWMWGGEMGVNQHGVAIGNEAVFTRLTRPHGEALLGMDLLRLGLERGASAREALAVITEHLERFGQAGAAGYRKKQFRYDSSFLIADPQECWVLETAGQLWAAKRVERWAISNALTLGHEFDLCSADLPQRARAAGCWNGRGDFHFARAFDTRLLPWIGGAHQRRACNQAWLGRVDRVDWRDLFAALREHGAAGDHWSRHNNRQVCMHAGSFWRPSQTTGSLVARLGEAPQLAVTATSAPCLGLFQPLDFASVAASALITPEDAPVEDSLWWRFEAVHRRALVEPGFRQALRRSRDEVEAALWSGAFAALDQQYALAWHARWSGEAQNGSLPLPRWWRRNARL